MNIDYSATLIEGPWEHRNIPARGCRFHVAAAGDSGPLVVLLHSFPEFWWSWRHQIPALAEAGYRVLAMDLRGYAASDKPPGVVTPMTHARDVAAVIRAAGDSKATVIGHGYGGLVSWTFAATMPEMTAGMGAFSAPHPSLSIRQAIKPTVRSRLQALRLPGFARHGLSTRRIAPSIIRNLSATDWLTLADSTIYQNAMSVLSAARSSTDQMIWLLRSGRSRAGRSYRNAMKRPVTTPVLHAVGAADPALQMDRLAVPQYVNGPYTLRSVPDAGHYLPEEAPDDVTDLIVKWLDSLDS